MELWLLNNLLFEKILYIKYNKKLSDKNNNYERDHKI